MSVDFHGVPGFSTIHYTLNYIICYWREKKKLANKNCYKKIFSFRIPSCQKYSGRHFKKLNNLKKKIYKYQNILLTNISFREHKVFFKWFGFYIRKKEIQIYAFSRGQTSGDERESPRVIIVSYTCYTRRIHIIYYIIMRAGLPRGVV